MLATKKSTVGTLGVAAVMALSAGLWTPSAAAEEIVLNMLRPWPLESNDLAGYRELLETVNAKGKGKVQLKDMGGSEVFPSREQLAVLKGGQADLLYTSTGYVASAYPEPSVLMYQFGATPDAVEEAGVIDKLDAIGRESNGVAFLGIPWFANAHVYLKEPIDSLEDLKSRKIRSHPSYDPLMKGLGVPTVQVPFSELYTALDRGVIDGIVFPYFDVKTYGLEKIVKYRIDPPFWRAGWVVLLGNAEKMDSLPDDARQIILDSVAEIQAKAPEMYDALAAKEAEELEAAGVQSLRIDEDSWMEAQRAAWEDGLPATLEAVGTKYGDELIQMMSQFYPPSEPYKTVGLQ